MPFANILTFPKDRGVGRRAPTTPRCMGSIARSASFGLTVKLQLTCAWLSNLCACWGVTRSAIVCDLPGMNRTSCNSRWASGKRFKLTNDRLSLLASAEHGYTLPMRPAPPRVAYFPDTFYEINGVAHTSRHFEAFAQRRNLPFFCLHPGKKGSAISEQETGELITLEIPRGSAVSFRLEKD